MSHPISSRILEADTCARRAAYIRTKIAGFKHDANVLAAATDTYAKYKFPNVIEMNREAVRKIAEWGFAYDEMLRGEYSTT